MGVPIYLDSLSGNEGWILAEPIRNEQGSILYPADKPLDTNTVEMLKKHFIKATNNKGSISKIHLQVKLNHKNLTPAQKIIIENIEKQNSDVKGNIPKELHEKTVQVLDQIYDNKNIKNVLNVLTECVSDIARKVITDPELSYSLGQYRKDGNDGKVNDFSNVVEHSSRVAEFAITLANLYNKQVASNSNQISLKNIGIASLLHDYGVCFQDEDEMEKLKKIELNESFFKAYPTIPRDVLQLPYNSKYKNVYAYAALKNCLDNSTLTAILLSNETQNGAGNECLNIPNNKTNQTAMAAQMIFLCNLYDSMLTNVISNNKSLENISSTLEILVKNGIINETIGRLFLDNIPLYSVGVRVELSTGEYATVIERFIGHNVAKPKVETLVNPPLVPRTIDLRETTTITVKRIVASNELLDDKIREITKEQLQTMEITSIEPFISDFEGVPVTEIKEKSYKAL